MSGWLWAPARSRHEAKMADRWVSRRPARCRLWLVVALAGFAAHGVAATATAQAEDPTLVSLTYPQNNDVLKPGGMLSIKGTAGSPYMVEYGIGYAPTVWSSDGITLTGGLDGVLALWNTASITRNDFYTLRLTSSGGPTRQRAYAHLVYFDTSLKEGWPQYIKMHSEYTLADNQLQPLVADLDGDGRQEVLLGDFPPAQDATTSRLLVYDADGGLKWARDLGVSPGEAGTLVSGNLDDDPFLEVLVVAAHTVYCFDHDGAACGGQWPLPIMGAITANVADLDGDGRSEVVLRSYWTILLGGSYKNFLYFLDGRGNVLNIVYPDFCPILFSNFGHHSGAVGNFDDDRALEVGTMFGCGGAAVYNLDGTMVPGWPHHTGGMVIGSFSAGDLDRDGKDELLVPATAWPDLGYPKSGMFAFGSGGVLPGWPVAPDRSFVSAPALGDLDGDGYPELSFTSAWSHVLYVVDGAGRDLPGWPQEIASYWVSSYFSSNDLADVDGDGRLDIVAVSGGINRNFVNNGNFDTLGGIAAWKANGKRIDLAPSYDSSTDLLGEFWPAGGTPIVTDLDGNGKIDVVWGTVGNALLCPFWAGGCVETFKYRHSLYVWELNAPYAHDPTAWPMFQRDPQHSGRLPQ